MTTLLHALLREQPHQSDSANGASFGWTAVAPKMRLPGPTPDGTERPVGEHRTEHGDADGVHSFRIRVSGRFGSYPDLRDSILKFVSASRIRHIIIITIFTRPLVV